MSDSMRMVLHAFAALADLGEEIAETSDFEEMVRSALHVVLGAMGIRRGAVAEFDALDALALDALPAQLVDVVARVDDRDLPRARPRARGVSDF